MIIEMKKRSTAAMISVTIIMSGLFGFGGAFLANEINGGTALETTMNNTESNSTLSSNRQNNTIQLISSTQTDTLTIAEIAQMNGDSIVEIRTETVATGGRMGQFVSEGAGSGVIISNDGYIVTNNHVIEGANKITVTLKNAETYTANLVGRDVKTDIAVLKIEASDLKAAILGDSSQLVVGELAVAIGNPLGELGGTVTEGIISALDRDIVIDGESMKLLQTSAAINPGNSGGGLFNAYGELVGIVNAKSSGSGIEGLGFAIPVNTAKTVIEQIISYGYVQGRIDLGITLLDIADLRTAMMYRVSNTGVYVVEAEQENGLQSGDRIVSINGTEMTSSSDVKSVIESFSVGQVVEFVLERGQQTLTIKITLEQAKA
ncbi:S1C family serine protease [Desulfosporosinus shakirovi]|uniref:S1C family serine protease n=1 Tax=Desulfosporosinus shakirovi TaxID=2885154 RepID=UPI001E352BDF|nr:trypsin-like peptidase domain-containing protein [Desulfosporosinus sp. SRJS8]MCB8816173.1 trypsin-like peptidase domain-containing protein [Desulfosporosinus sp. SRJS8]